MRVGEDGRSLLVLRYRIDQVCMAHRQSFNKLSVGEHPDSHAWLYSHDRHRVVVEHGGDIFARELVGGVTDEKARFSNGTVTDHDTSASTNG